MVNPGIIKRNLRSAAFRFGSLFRSLGLPEPIFRHLHFVGTFDTRLPGNQTVRLMSWGNRVENELYWRGWKGHEPDMMAAWIHHASNGGDILDIGANTGVFAFFAKTVAPSARVFAFEPVPRIAALAKENCQISGLDVHVLNMAIADAEGDLPIYDPGGRNAYSASLEPDFLPGEKKTYNVSVTTIDRFSESKKLSPRLIKLDVEGAEGRAILGAKSVLRDNDCIILCEWLGTTSSHEPAIRLLSELGYEAADITTLSPLDLRDRKAQTNRNIIIARAETLSELRKKVDRKP